MSEVTPESIDLVVTSPPYWHIKDYGAPNQVGYGQTLHEYSKDLYRVWKKCFKAIRPGRRLCVNIGDQFARSIVYGRYKIIPLHSEIITQCEDLGFDYMGSIIWQKKTTMNTTGGANVMGSYPYPPNGMVEIDYEFILIFKKPGKSEKIPIGIKNESKLSLQEWKEYFLGHWYFAGARQVEHKAMFPDELPKRIIKMFTFAGDTVLDPFLGSGTTAKVALNLNRNTIGYEIHEPFLKVIKNKLGIGEGMLKFDNDIQVIKSNKKDRGVEEVDYIPSIKDAEPKIDPKKFKFTRDRLYKVTGIIDDLKIVLDTGLTVKLLGANTRKKQETIKYLKDYVQGKEIFLKLDNGGVIDKETIEAYVYLKNKIFVNAYLIKSGLASVDTGKAYKFKTRFIELFEKG